MNTNVIIARKSKSNPNNISFLGFTEDSLGFLTQEVDWKAFKTGADAGLKVIKDKNLKGHFVNGAFQFSETGFTIEVQ